MSAAVPDFQRLKRDIGNTLSNYTDKGQDALRLNLFLDNCTNLVHSEEKWRAMGEELLPEAYRVRWQTSPQTPLRRGEGL